MVFYFFGGKTQEQSKKSKSGQQPSQQQHIPLTEIKPKKLIIHCCHHKTGTVVIEKILRNVCSHFGLKYQYCPQSKLEDDTDYYKYTITNGIVSGKISINF